MSVPSLRSGAPIPWLVAALVLLASRAGAHPGEAAHQHPRGSEGARAHEAERAEPTEAEIAKRLERVKKAQAERTANRVSRRQDERRALRAVVRRRLGARPVTAEVREELALHARRLARLRRIRFVAAEQGDYPSVRRADKALAMEKGRHERWWRAQQAAPAPAASASAAVAEETP